MGPLVIPAIMAAAYLTKSLAVDKPKEDRMRHLRAEEQRYAPWSGNRQLTQVEEADPFGATLGGASQGMGLAQSFEAANQDQAARDSLKKELTQDAQNQGQGPTMEAQSNWLGQQPKKKNMWESYYQGF